ncbi:Glycine dehydrogenase (decarboxylating) [Planctopirus limnophila DSM 3776]|uniref:Probable glycine dehydrogenase (decarboxylating) subunit 1 n=1 Tax=Planctopirus limnophila (strain ATCC 43296 / DSM 3776 / IFAM 1008 / Mu 290) TaxID=521674 RepID=D5SQ44_PLAL2|nr:aminomethyl-transferring glycine dehydrogenase subunit GcvPA [Planctopirus limnophila]ADG68419.1 Glycine dehydrogenase (decarboxylating) [Planctopirus limnophila DSM 3776]
MSYLFATATEEQAMLSRIGVDSIDQLLQQIPKPLQLDKLLDLPPALSEMELEQHLRQLASQSSGATSRMCFQGGGAYDHYIPSVVDEITGRGEYYTAYTPYQAEASQGTLQAFFEYQTMICQLTGMQVSNASLYEGGGSVSEATLMAMRTTGRTGRVVIAGALHPEYTQVLRTYVGHTSTEVIHIPVGSDGTVDLTKLAGAIDENTAAVIVQNPNFLGNIEDLAAIADLTHAKESLMVVSTDPISLGLLARPGELGADIVVAEGQSLGIPLQFGGPYLGILACRNDFIRRMPGRLIGETIDRTGGRCFVLSLQAREQHIRRDKATSNICTNQGLMALRATMFMAQMGPQGFKETAELCLQKAHYAARQIAAIPGYTILFSETPKFKEFVIQAPQSAPTLIEKVAKAGVDIGPALSQFAPIPGMPDTENLLLVAVTEQRTKAQIDHLVNLLK